MGIEDKDLTKAKEDARRIIQSAEKALKKHIRLIKKRERVSSVVAMIERLRGDLGKSDAKTIWEHIKKLNALTQGFARRALKKKNAA